MLDRLRPCLSRQSLQNIWEVYIYSTKYAVAHRQSVEVDHQTAKYLSLSRPMKRILVTESESNSGLF